MRKNLFVITLLVSGMLAMGCVVKVNEGAPPPPPPPPPAQTTQPAKPATQPKPAVKPAQPKPTTKPRGRLALNKLAKFRFGTQGELQLPGPVLFAPGTSTLLPESDAVLQIVHDYLKAKPEVTKMRVEGHSDLSGNEASNMQLSKDRAMACVKWLRDKGTDCNRLLPVGFGETKPIKNPEQNEDDKAQNRRVMFISVEKNGNALQTPLDGGGQSAGNPCQ